MPRGRLGGKARRDGLKAQRFERLCLKPHEICRAESKHFDYANWDQLGIIDNLKYTSNITSIVGNVGALRIDIDFDLDRRLTGLAGRRCNTSK